MSELNTSLCNCKQIDLRESQDSRDLCLQVEYDISGISLCKCGAVIMSRQYENYFCHSGRLSLVFPLELAERIGEIAATLIPEFNTCNHCVNHYGLDLCGCGSGQAFGNCENEYDECCMPHQTSELVLSSRDK